MINQANSRNGGGNQYFTNPNFVTQNISKELGDKILSNTLKPITKDMNFYISNNGDDETADGSQSKPFKTLQGCADYIKNNYFFTSKSRAVYIKFLTDYTETSNLVAFTKFVNGSFGSANFSVIVDGVGHNVILKSVRGLDTSLGFRNVTLNTNVATDYVINSGIYAQIYLYENCVININNDNKVVFDLTSLGNVQLINTVTINLNNYSCRYLIRANHNASFGCNYSGNPTISLNGDSTFSDCLCVADRLSKIALPTPIIANGTITGKKYIISGNSILDLLGKGSSTIPGSIEGELKTGGQLL